MINADKSYQIQQNYPNNHLYHDIQQNHIHQVYHPNQTNSVIWIKQPHLFQYRI